MDKFYYCSIMIDFSDIAYFRGFIDCNIQIRDKNKAYKILKVAKKYGEDWQECCEDEYSILKTCLIKQKNFINFLNIDKALDCIIKKYTKRTKEIEVEYEFLKEDIGFIKEKHRPQNRILQIKDKLTMMIDFRPNI
ncbi:hypothetical protein CPIN17260_0035 [Campylobacter pinnipediorum subsp. pinnipediorum]|uniref:Uncharacterized protein n=1 Tax=Campylobacter pinnipediorum subsp. pinnipediorum TaxID=1660067 RepID=A0AAX0LC86_9BACT|nr:hypothetical protein [Campylobacter pinnipediorum]AQW80395.1 hypothetical protein CPIN17260_0035 [Campylobacter pinnipediorum subsp. pinnipediorum]OPA81970.1 hypothetical protein BFG04_08190 [Campylobacter pinnipediorum subsp. pinnipediorum]